MGAASAANGIPKRLTIDRARFTGHLPERMMHVLAIAWLVACSTPSSAVPDQMPKIQQPVIPSANSTASCSGWFNLHAGVMVPAGDSEALERLIRYTARPPLALDRLRELEDGRVLVRFTSGSPLPEPDPRHRGHLR